MKDNKQYLFISFSNTRWDGPWYVRQKLMSEIAKNHKVIYVTPRQELRTILTNIFKIKKWNLGIRKINNNLFLIESPWIFPKLYRFKQIDMLIDCLYHLFIKITIALFAKHYIKLLYLWEPNFSSFRRYYPKYKYIYHSYDRFDRYTYSPQNRKRANSPLKQPNDTELQLKVERDLVQNAFLFYSVSEALCDYYYKTFDRKPKLLINAVANIYFNAQRDTRLQQKAKSIVSNFPNKKIAFSGGIKGALDLDIIIDSANRLNSYSFLFLGPIRHSNIDEYDDKVARLLSLSNVYYLGSFQVKLLPYLLRQMDILLMLYSSNKDISTYYSGPAKLFEYMAIPKPIISTPHPAINKYKEYIVVVNDSSQFVSAVKQIDDIYNPKLLEKMIEIARKNTWDERMETILRDIQSNLV